MQPRRPTAQPSDEALNEALRRVMLAALPDRHPNPELTRYYRLLRESLERDGVRLCGRLLLRSASAHGGAWDGALPAAAGLELLHSWSSIHGEIENDSEVWRGRATLHREVGMPVALNAGDGLHMYMWQLLVLAPWPRREAILNEFTRLVHRAAEGRHLDLAWVEQGRLDVSEAEYLDMAMLKASSWWGALRLGALCADRDPSPELERAGIDLGVAFQIREDVRSLRPGGRREEAAGGFDGARRTLPLVHLFTHARPDDRAEAADLLARLRYRRSRDDAERLLTLVENYGSPSYAQGIAETRARRGADTLQEALSGAPDQAAAAELARLAQPLGNHWQ